MATQSIMQALRARVAGRQQPVAELPEAPLFDISQARAAVQLDQGLTGNQRATVINLLEDPAFVGELKSGATGGALTYLITKYLKLKPKTQLLLSIAGFGVGKIIYDYKHDPKNSSRYNPKLKMYELKD